MIIRCKECKSRFYLNENILKKDGSKVRCSICKNIFTVFPPEPEAIGESTEDDFPIEAMEETVALDSLPDSESSGFESLDEGGKDSFDQLFEDALEQGIQEFEDSGLEEIEERSVDEEEDRTEGLYEKPDTDLVTSPVAHPRKGKKERSRVLLITLIIILVFIVCTLVVFFLAPGILPDSLSVFKPVKKEEIIDTGIRRLAFQDVSGSFLQNILLGQLYVIKGNVINNYPKGRSFLLLKGTILDENGEIVKQKLIYAGNTFTEKQLREMNLEEIDKGLKKQAGEGNININIEPGNSVPFMIIFANLPDNLAEFVVEVVSSSPGE